MALMICYCQKYIVKDMKIKHYAKKLDEVLSVRLALYLIALGVLGIALQKLGFISNKRVVDVHIVDESVEVNVSGDISTDVRGDIDVDVNGSINADVSGDISVYE